MNDTSDIRAMLIESATRLFADQVDAKMLAAAKRDGWSPTLWKIVAEAQLPLVSIAEEVEDILGWDGCIWHSNGRTVLIVRCCDVQNRCLAPRFALPNHA